MLASCCAALLKSGEHYNVPVHALWHAQRCCGCDCQSYLWLTSSAIANQSLNSFVPIAIEPMDTLASPLQTLRQI